MKKVLLCTNAYEQVTNGPARFANLFHNSYQMHNFFVPYVLTEDMNGEDQERLFKLKMSNFAQNNLFSQLFRNYYYYKQIKKLNKQIEFDAILFNNSNTGILTSLFYKKKSFGFINDNENIDTKVFPVKFERSYYRRVYLKFLEKISTKTFETIVTNSNFLTDLVIKKYKLNSNKIKRLYKAINLESLKSYEWDNSYEEGSVVITFVKNDYVRGGLWDLAKSLQLLDKYNFKLNIIGPDFSSKKLIEDRCKATNIEINFLGPKKQEQIIQILLKSHIFCTPARAEALGVANIEALAIGVPVVTTNVGGIPEVINNGENGYLAEVCNPESLKLKIEECFINVSKTKIKINNGKDFVKIFSIEILIKNIYELIKNN
tara:strand:- start:8626 stop:9747 length:1122 start_codon:yes stop_codon:yes gene_type:complete